MAVNTYGIKMKGLKKVSGETKGLQGYYSPEYLEIFFDKNSGEIWTKYQYSLGQNSWTQYYDTDVIKVANASSPMTMQEIARLVKMRMEDEQVWM